MLNYIIRRILLMFPTLLGITAVVFFVMALSPGGIGAAVLSEQGDMDADGSQSKVQQYYEERYGLNKPYVVQYVRWLNLISPIGYYQVEEVSESGEPTGETVSGFGFKMPDLGESMGKNLYVIDLIGDALPISLLLNVLTIPIVYVIAVLSGIYMAQQRGQSFDVVAGTTFLGLYSLPVIWVGVMLIGYFASPTFVDWFPSGGLRSSGVEAMTYLPSWNAENMKGMTTAQVWKTAFSNGQGMIYLWLLVMIPSALSLFALPKLIKCLTDKLPFIATFTIGLLGLSLISYLCALGGSTILKLAGVQLGLEATAWQIFINHAFPVLICGYLFAFAYSLISKSPNKFSAYWLGLIGVILGISYLTFWLPATGMILDRGYLVDLLWHLVFPIICLTYAGFAFLSKVMRTSVLENISADYVRTAKAKGLDERTVLLRHVFRNSLLPLITISAGILPALIGGSLIVEQMFSINGMGLMGYQAVLQRDREVVMAVTLIAGLLGLSAQIIADVCYAIADPRVSYE